MILHIPELVESLASKGATLILDTGVYIKASKNPDFLQFIKKLSSNDQQIGLMTVPPVFIEFVAGAETPVEYRNLSKFFNSVGAIIDPRSNDYVNYDEDFNLVLQKSVKKASFTDKLLCMTLNKYKHMPVFLVSANHRDIPHFFDLGYVITLDIGHELHNIGFYSINDVNYQKTLTGLIEGKK